MPKTAPRVARQADPLDTPSLSEALRALARRGVVRSYRKGTLLIQEGDQGDTLYIILDGKLRAFGTGNNDREITYGTYGPGEYLGEMSLDGGPRSASVECLQPSTCAVITRQTLMTHIGEHPEFAFELLGKVIRRARAATHSLRQIALNDVYGRLALLFNELSATQAPAWPRRIERMTHHELAARIGCSREMVSRLMKDLVEGGYLDVAHDRITLTRSLPARW